MIVKLDYDKIRNGDYIFTGSNSLLAAGIRIFSAGIKNAFNPMIPTHEGIAVWSKIGNVDILQIAEMLPGKDGQPGDLKFHPMSKYLQKGLFSPFIISVKRSEFYQDSTKVQKLIDNIAALWVFGKTLYDYSGIAKYIIGFIKDSPKKLYCSQLRQMLDIENWLNPLPEVSTLRVTPFQHFKSALLKTIAGA